MTGIFVDQHRSMYLIFYIGLIYLTMTDSECSLINIKFVIFVGILRWKKNGLTPNLKGHTSLHTKYFNAQAAGVWTLLIVTLFECKILFYWCGLIVIDTHYYK